jgi:hypothetical protein
MITRQNTHALTILATCCCLGFAAQNAYGSLVHHWALEGDYTDSVGSADGSPGPGGVSLAAGAGILGGGAVSFSGAGNSYVDVGTLGFAPTLTLSAWVKPDTVESGADQDMIIANGWDGARTDWWLGLNQINNAEVARFEGGFHQTEGAFAGDFTDGAWHLVTGVIDGPTFTVYIDGAFAQSSSVSLGLDGVSNTAVYIGAI